MGRRNRSKRGWDEEDSDGDLGKAELDWLSKRQKTSQENKTTKQQQVDSSDVATTVSTNNPEQSPQTEPGDEHSPLTSASSSSPKDKEERLRLKKQRQKQRRKEKKAEKSAADAAIKQSNMESEKALQSKLKKEMEKKAKIKSAQNKFITVAKGVQYQDLVVGKGPTVSHRKKCRVSYVLRSKSHTSGKIIDSSKNYGFRLGKGEVIAGYDIGLQGMRVGGVRRLIVPPAAGYGQRDVGAGRGADLFFEIELLHVAP